MKTLCGRWKDEIVKIDWRKYLAPNSPTALGLGIAGFFTPTIALYTPKGIIVVFCLAALIGLFGLYSHKHKISFRLTSLDLPIIALAFWANLSLIWSTSLDLSLSLAVTLPFTLLGGWALVNSVQIMGDTERIFINRSTVIGFLLGVILVLIDIKSGYKISLAIEILKHGGDWNSDIAPFVINNGITVITMFLWPVCIYLCRHKFNWLALIAVLIVAFVAANGSNFAAVVAITIGNVCFLLAFVAPRQIHKLIVIGLSVVFFSAPFVMKSLPDGTTIGEKLPELSKSVYPRLVIWQYASDLALNQPIIGHGIRTSRTFNDDSKPIWFLFRSNGETLKGNTKRIPLHPHNGIIQLWLELGLVGVAIGFGFILAVLKSIKAHISQPIPKALMYSGLISSISLVSVSYGLWQNWWLAALWLQGVLIMSSATSSEKSTQAP